MREKGPTKDARRMLFKNNSRFITFHITNLLKHKKESVKNSNHVPILLMVNFRLISFNLGKKPLIQASGFFDLFSTDLTGL